MSNLTAMQILQSAKTGKMRNQVLFIDRAAELSKEDKELLGELGFTVVEVVGNPYHVLDVRSV